MDFRNDAATPRTRHLGFALIALWVGIAAGCSPGTQPNPDFNQCDKSVSPDKCDSMQVDADSEEEVLATDIALRYIDEHPPETEIWDWTSGVLMFAMTELHRVTGDSRIRDYYREWLEYHIDQGYEYVQSDSCPPALTAIALLAEEENPTYRKPVDGVLEYLRVTAPRNPEGGIAHFGILLSTDAIWIDSLFMFGMVLNRQGELDDDVVSLDLLSEQYRIFQQLLQSSSGLMVHAYGWPADDDIYWARGNSWVTASLADYLRVRFLRGERDPDAEQMLRAQVDGILATQDGASDMWWNLMNRPGEIYIETSGAALFAYALARAYRYGFLGETELSAAKRAMVGVRGRVLPDGEGRPVVTEISDGTTAGPYQLYASVPLRDDLNYGVGTVILALIETSGL